MSTITRETYIEDIVENYPTLVRPLREYNIQCIACGDPIWGTLEEAAKRKGVQNLDEIIVELNKIIENKEE